MTFYEIQCKKNLFLFSDFKSILTYGTLALLLDVTVTGFETGFVTELVSGLVTRMVVILAELIVTVSVEL